MTKIDRENVMQTWEAIHDAALTRHEDGGAELARLVINADDLFGAVRAALDEAEAALKRVRKEEREATLDAASKYLKATYGMGALSHPADRSRIASLRARGETKKPDSD